LTTTWREVTVRSEPRPCDRLAGNCSPISVTEPRLFFALKYLRLDGILRREVPVSSIPDQVGIGIDADRFRRFRDLDGVDDVGSGGGWRNKSNVSPEGNLNFILVPVACRRAPI
jgi:hypothetical protein